MPRAVCLEAAPHHIDNKNEKNEAGMTGLRGIVTARGLGGAHREEARAAHRRG
jgi:hypothetical protein